MHDYFYKMEEAIIGQKNLRNQEPAAETLHDIGWMLKMCTIYCFSSTS